MEEPQTAHADDEWLMKVSFGDMYAGKLPVPHVYNANEFLVQGSFSAEKQKEEEAHCRGFHSVNLILSVHQLQQSTLIWKMTGKGIKATTVTRV